MKPLNRIAVLFHVREAAEELNALIQQLAIDRRYSEAELELALGHAYHHLNTAWNGRRQTTRQFNDCSDADFNRFRKFPKEREFVYLDDPRK